MEVANTLITMDNIPPCTDTLPYYAKSNSKQQTANTITIN